MTVTGTAVPRKEDPRLLRGRGAFTDGFHARGELWARIVRSPVAHGRVRAVDMTKARRASGVAAAVSAAELPPGLAIPVRLALRGLSLTEYLQPVLAADVVRYVGEPLAVVGYGDADAAFARAARVVETRIEIGRHTGVPLEPRALLAEPDPRTGGLSITGMTKVPVFNRDVLAGLL